MRKPTILVLGEQSRVAGTATAVLVRKGKLYPVVGKRMAEHTEKGSP